eukprot:COSAG05_NODE_11822_length_494_cov_2.303797_2_plen_30_part_01
MTRLLNVQLREGGGGIGGARLILRYSEYAV